MLTHSTVLSGVAGYIDAAGFVSLLGLFPNHLTGELVGDAIALSSGHLSAHAHLWVFPVFVGAVTLATLVARLLRHYGMKARAGLLGLVTLALALFSVSDALARLLHEGQLPILVRGGFAVAAMGFQSALMRESLTGSCPTTVMTGNLTQVVIEVVDHAVGRVTRSVLRGAKSHSRLAPVGFALLVFAFSATLGGWLTRAYGSISVVVPTLLTAALMLQAWREDSASAASEPLPPSVPNFEKDDLWPDLFVSQAEETAASDSLLSVGAAGDRGSATRIKVAAVVQAAPARRIKLKRSISGTQRMYR